MTLTQLARLHEQVAQAFFREEKGDPRQQRSPKEREAESSALTEGEPLWIWEETVPGDLTPQAPALAAVSQREGLLVQLEEALRREARRYPGPMDHRRELG